MTRKDYQAIAKILNDSANKAESCLPVFDIAESLAIHFKADNARFDKNKFMQACGFVYNM